MIMCADAELLQELARVTHEKTVNLRGGDGELAKAYREVERILIRRLGQRDFFQSARHAQELKDLGIE
jgi:hypothetical protein